MIHRLLQTVESVMPFECNISDCHSCNNEFLEYSSINVKRPISKHYYKHSCLCLIFYSFRIYIMSFENMLIIYGSKLDGLKGPLLLIIFSLVFTARPFLKLFRKVLNISGSQTFMFYVHFEELYSSGVTPVFFYF